MKRIDELKEGVRWLSFTEEWRLDMDRKAQKDLLDKIEELQEEAVRLTAKPTERAKHEH